MRYNIYIVCLVYNYLFTYIVTTTIYYIILMENLISKSYFDKTITNDFTFSEKKHKKDSQKKNFLSLSSSNLTSNEYKSDSQFKRIKSYFNPSIPLPLPVETETEEKIGNYLLKETLGEGAFGLVKLGVHIITNHKVAIKILDKNRMKDEEEDIVRVKNEIRILKRMKHRFIVQLYEIIESRNKIYLVLEYCQGKELFDYIVDSSRLDEQEACRIFQQIINGVEYLHLQGIVHRDLKPENILLDYNMNIKISDFGLSNTYINDNLLSTPCGTPSYAPPEMLRGENYHGLLSDLWSCGIILYAMLCGFLPFSESNEELNCNNIVNGVYEMPEYLSDSVMDLISNILKTDPVERFDILQVKSHPWFGTVKPNLYPGLIIDIHQVPVDEMIIDEINTKYFYSQLSYYQKEEIVSNLKNNKFDYFSAVYYLEVNQNRKFSISNLSSDRFVEYILSDLCYIDDINNMSLSVDFDLDTNQKGIIDEKIGESIEYIKDIGNKDNKPIVRDTIKKDLHESNMNLTLVPPSQSSSTLLNDKHNEKNEIDKKPKIKIINIKEGKELKKNDKTRNVGKFINENNKKPKQKAYIKKQTYFEDVLYRQDSIPKKVKTTNKSKQNQLFQHQFTTPNKKVSNGYAYSSKKDKQKVKRQEKMKTVIESTLIDLSCIVHISLPLLLPLIEAYFTKNKISFLSTSTYKYKASKNGIGFGIELLLFDFCPSSDMYYIQFKLNSGKSYIYYKDIVEGIIKFINNRSE